MCWNGVGVDWRVLEWIGGCWSGLELLGIVLEWSWSSLECVGVCWNGVGVEWRVLEWLGMVLEWS